MRALVRTVDGTRWIDTPRPSIGRNEVVVRVHLVGLCRTDLAVADGRLPVQMPRILGHELVGVVEELGTDVDQVAVGDRVSAHPVVACLQCKRCQSGWPEACEHGEFLGVDRDGALAQCIALPAANVFVVPSQVEDRVAALLEPVAACAAVLKAPLDKGSAGMVVGNGRLAKLTVWILLSAGFQNVRQVSVGDADAVSDCAEFVVETEGTQASLKQCFDLLRPGGKLVLKSRPLLPIPLDLRGVLTKEPKLFAVNYLHFSEALKLLEDRSIKFSSILGRIWPANQFEEAFAEANRNEQQKQFISVCVES